MERGGPGGSGQPHSRFEYSIQLNSHKKGENIPKNTVKVLHLPLYSI